MLCQTTMRPTSLLISLIPLLIGASPDKPPASSPAVPVALAWAPDKSLRVALRDSRQLATIDPEHWTITSRRDLPFRPAFLIFDQEGRTLLVGGFDGELMAIREGNETLLRPTNQRGIVRAVPLANHQALVASTWDPALHLIDLNDGRTLRSIPLPFPPGRMVALSHGKVIVADAFGGRLALIDTLTGHMRTRKLDGANLRALALSNDRKELLIGHMTQYGPVPVNGSNIDWGLVLSSRLSAVRLSEFTAEGRDDASLDRRTLTLDGSRHGSADPSAIAISPDGSVLLIALSGAHQILKNDRRATQSTLSTDSDPLPLGESRTLDSLEVGRNPVDLVIDPTGQFAISANAMSDSLTVIRVSDLSRIATIPLGPPAPARTAAQRGEALFLDGRRALDRWMSCASCHAAGHTSNLKFDTLGDGGYGAAKNTPSLLGVGATPPYSWSGRFRTLEEQVKQSLQTSLRGPLPDDSTVNDIVAYLHSLTPPPPRRSPDDPSALRGAKVFEARRCQSCHRPPSFTTQGPKDVGLDDGEAGHKAFNTPSLLGVGWTPPYLHDGRSATLDDVLEIHPQRRSHPLSPADRADLKAYLESL